MSLTSTSKANVNYGSMSLQDLRTELRKRKAKLSGRKHELVTRLESYDRNFNFGKVHCDEGCFQMTTPEATMYLDVNSDSQIPEVTEKNIRAFHALHEQDLYGKAESLYYGKFLNSVRYCRQDDSNYILGRVSAEMKTKGVYRVDLKLNMHGVIEESQCECAVGMGPEAHCKHVAVVYCAVSKKNEKEGIVTKDTCTELLQTFHQARKYSGSPVRMSELKLRKKNNIHKLKDFDPRPVELRNQPQYPDAFRNVWLNAQEKDLPIRQLYAPANIMAINIDHDYLEKTHEEHFLDDLHVTTISEEQHAATEEATMGQSTNKAWKE